MDNNKHCAYLLKLLFSLINETEPPAPDDEIDFGCLYELAKLHDVLNMSYYAIEKLDITIDSALKKKWADKRSQCFHRNLIQTAEFHALCDAFEREGVEFMPLKGLYICELYPSPDYRYMSDLDLLVKDAAKAGEAAKGLGYTAERINFMYDDSYIKPPFMHLELHRDLFRIDSPFYDYYQDAFERAVNSGGSRYDMTPEDSYVYFITHLYKHYCESGTGIRSVMDIYLLDKKHLPKLDRADFDSKLDELGLKLFYEEFSALAEKWFGRGDFECFSDEELYILGSGTFGLTDNKILNRLNQLGEEHFYLKRIFPPPAYMKDIFYPVRKCPPLLPIFYLYRIIRLISPKYRKKVEYELKVLKDNQDKN